MKHWILLLSVAFVSFGCDEAFEPLAPSDAAFSLYGYLDSDASNQDADSVYKALGMRVGNRQLELLHIQMRMSSLSREWYTPGGTRDPEVLAAPGVWSNVSYGLGFFGSITRTRRNVPTLPAEVVAGIGF